MSNINENNLIPISISSLKPGQRMETRTLSDGRVVYVVQGVGGATAPTGNSSSQDFSTATEFTSGALLAGEKGFNSTGSLIEGSMPTSTPTMDGNTVTVPKGYVSSDQQFTVESSGGGMEFYECDSVGGGAPAIVLEGTQYAGTYIQTDVNATGSGRVFSCAAGEIRYDEGFVSSWYLFPTGAGSILSTSLTENPNATVAEMASQFNEASSDIGFGGTFKAISGGSPSWSGYKMAWSDTDGWVKSAQKVDDLTVSGYAPEVGKVYSADTTINGNMYPAELPSEGESSGGGEPYIEVSGAGTPEVDGKYYLEDNTAVGSARRLVTKDGTGYIAYDSSGEWLINSTKTSLPICYAATCAADISLEDLCDADWYAVMAGVSPAPTLTYSTDDGSATGGSGIEAGSTKAGMLIKFSYGSPCLFESRNATATGNDRLWTSSENPSYSIKWNGSKWIMWDSDYDELMIEGDSSSDPWDCVWVSAEYTIKTYSWFAWS